MKQSILFSFFRAPKCFKAAYRTLISALLLVGFTASAQGETIELMANKPEIVPLEVAAKEYWVGKVSVDRKISMQLMDGNDRLIRQFPARVGSQDLHIQPSAILLIPRSFPKGRLIPISKIRCWLCLMLQHSRVVINQ